MRNRVVLLVEDDPESLVVMAAVLRKAGCVVLTAGHEDTAIAHILDHPEINVIITDACFEDGREDMCMAAHVRRCGSNAAIIVTSTDPYATCATLGDEAIFLLKPYGRKALLSAVAAAAKAHEMTIAAESSRLQDAADESA